ncbi:MAG: MCP four helix bundle domain-containing protein, partial [Azoarcus sp.]|nr:MCP four helix bundle domain-containing protein [Azoarcus sp.]
MNWLLNLAIRTKLLLAFGLMLALIAVLIGGAYWGLNVIQQTQKTLFERDMVISMELVGLRAELNQQRSNILIMLLESQRVEQEALENKIINGEAGLDQRVASLTAQ